MDVLAEISRIMTKEEVRFYKLNLPAQAISGTRKDLILFDKFRRSKSEPDENLIFKKLYPGKDKNAYYRLKNRLAEDLNASLVQQHFSDDEYLYLYHLLSLVKIYSARNSYKLALHYLRKLELKAAKLENLELLDIIFGEYIQLSHHLIDIDPERYIKLRKENAERLASIREMDDMLAVLSYRLKLSQNFGDVEHSSSRLIEQVLAKVEGQKDLAQSARFRFKVYSLLSQLMIQRKEFTRLEPYLLGTWERFNAEGLFNRTNHDTKLQMLTYIVNTLFKNGKTAESLRYAAELHAAMKEYGNLYYSRYEIFYYNSLVNNYSRIDQHQAIVVLKQMLEIESIKKEPFYEIFIYLNLATSYFDLQQFNTAVRNLHKLYHTEGYKSADPALKFKIAVAELIIRYEMGDFDFWLHRYEQIVKEHREELNRTSNNKERDLLKLLIESIKVLNQFRNSAVRKKALRFCEIYADKQGDDEVINYNTWLNAKLHRN